MVTGREKVNMAMSKTHSSIKSFSPSSKMSLLSYLYYICIITLDRRQSKMIIISTNHGPKSLETEFLIAICCLTGDKWQSKTLFLVIFDPCLIVDC